MKKPHYIAIAALLLLLVAGTVYLFYRSTSNNLTWNVPPEKVAKDLEGRSVSLFFNQIWPFENSQNISVKIVTVKHVDEFAVVVVELSGTAKVDQSKETNKKDEKLPKSIGLSGMARLTYENIGGTWYLIAVDNISLRVSAAN